jgi:ribosomal protein L3 glutamine methyltransferase
LNAPRSASIRLLSRGSKGAVDPALLTLRQLIDRAAAQLEAAKVYFGHGTDNALDEAAFLVLRSVNLPFAVAGEVLDQPLARKECERVLSVIDERIRTRRPAAYILHEAWFAGLPFYINESVLVPRSPLAEMILGKFQPWCNEEKIRRILDIGTGCGCIAVASALAFPEARIDAVDISTDALAVAKKNVEHYGLGARVSVIQSDLFQELGDLRYDLIIANPPYVSEEELAGLPAEYRHEPETGLLGGPGGLDVVERILSAASGHLTEHGVLAVEVGSSQQTLINQYPDVPFLWLEFERGGEGVFLLTRDELIRWFE